MNADQTQVRARQHTSAGPYLLPPTNTPENQSSSSGHAGVNAPDYVYSTSTHQTPLQQLSEQPGTLLPPSIYHPAPHSTKMTSHRTDGFHFPGGLEDTAGVGGGVSMASRRVAPAALLD